MNTVRSFIAIELDEIIHARLDELENTLKNAGVRGIRWVPGRNIHLTLKFLDEVPLPKIKALASALTSEAALHHPFELQIGRLGAFPSPQRARVVWVGVRAPAALGLLQGGIEAATTPLGFPGEDRPFSPHLTLGRTIRNITPDEQASLAKILHDHADFTFPGSHKVSGFVLFKSELMPTGAEYSPLNRFVFPD